ncbi:hypothetical protein CEXT_312981 [Caerostris extrusa]|uniref:Uncharacterized protein n=1 Tax=Caerostris extrusa TaxID=172846 RepID=A0AAV4MB81_CAEEX|nr:hypothetical protein CEXT_312981 [Caerostris extrusa]
MDNNDPSVYLLWRPHKPGERQSSDGAAPDNLTANELNCLIEEIQNNIYNTLAKPRDISNNNRTNKKKKNAIWWTKELGIKRSKTRALRRYYQKERDPDIRARKRENFKKNLSEYKKFLFKKASSMKSQTIVFLATIMISSAKNEKDISSTTP